MISKVWIVPEIMEQMSIIDTYKVIDEFDNTLIDNLDPWQISMVTDLLRALGVAYVEEY